MKLRLTIQAETRVRIMTRIFITSSTWLISAVLLLLILSSPRLQAQRSLKFPMYLRYSAYVDGQPFGKVDLLYNPDTGLKRFNREISSLRWCFRPNDESDYKYVQEAYIFRDNFSLYCDAMISSENGVYSRFTLNEISQGDRTFINDNGSLPPNFSQTDIDMSQVSSLLLAAQKVMAANQAKDLYRYLSHDGNHRPMRIMVVAQMQENIAGKSIPVDVISLTYNYEEIHHYKIYKDNDGYCYPAAVYFNINDAQRSMGLILDEFPKPQPLQNPAQTSVVYLDFMEATGRSLKNQTPVDRLVRGPVYNRIKKELNAAVIGSGKQLVLDMNSGKGMNTASQIKQILEITFDQEMSLAEKMEEIFTRLKIPALVDIIVTGQYVDNPGSANIMIRPVVIMKNNPGIKTNNLMFDRARLLCREPGTGQEVPCRNSENYIAKEVRQFLLPALKFNRANRELTIEDAYRLVIENRYFCHGPDYGYHSEVLEHLRELERIEERDTVRVIHQGRGEASHYSYTFKGGWEVRPVIESNKKIVKTISVDKDDYARVISLYWDLAEGSETTYDKAQQMIDVLNAADNEGHSDWRLPTLEELLCIISDQSTRPYFFPFDLSSKRVNMIWTSTPLEENEKRRLTPGNTDVFFILKRVSDRQGEKVQFDILEKDCKAFFLPVRSPISAGRQSSQSGQKGLTIAGLSFLNATDRSPMVYGDLGRGLNKVVNNGMNMVVAFNNAFTIRNGGQASFSTDSNANLLANIFFNPNLTNEKKVRQIIDTLMTPYKLDLLVTGLFIDDGSGMIRVRPMVVYKYNQTIKTGNLQFRRTEFECQDNGNQQKTICSQAASQIADAIKKLLEQA